MPATEFQIEREAEEREFFRLTKFEKRFVAEGAADLPLAAAKSLLTEKRRRLHRSSKKQDANRAGFILSEERDPSRADALRPIVRDAFALRKWDRRGHNQPRLHRLEKASASSSPE